MIIVTSYLNPDLDGVGAAVGYAELLRGQGREACAAISGVPFVEAQWVLRSFGITKPTELPKVISNDAEVVLVDTSGSDDLDPAIIGERVVEVIDHRAGTDPGHHFPNAKLQIELVGAATTLIAERIRNAGKIPSRETAILLLGGIFSNTMNFGSLNTTARDHAMRKWLEPVARVPQTFVHNMFHAKTQLVLQGLNQAIRADGLVNRVAGVPITTGQLEIIGVRDVIRDRYDELRAVMEGMKRDGGARYALLNCIDLEAQTTDMLVFDKESEELYGRAVGHTFTNGHAHVRGILLRKQIMPLVRQILEHEKVL